jgi:hypothetical protein
LVLQTDQEGRGIGVLAILVLIVGLFLVLNALWRGDKRRKAARDKAIVDRVLERAYQNPGEPINLRRLARQSASASRWSGTCARASWSRTGTCSASAAPAKTGWSACS